MLKLNHNYESGVLTEKDRAKRVPSACSSISFHVPHCKRTELAHVLSLHAQSDSMDFFGDTCHATLVSSVTNFSLRRA